MVHRMLGRIHAVIGATALGSLVLVAAPANAATAPPAPTQLTVAPGTVVVKDAAGTKAMFNFRTIGGAPGSAKLVDSAGKTIDLQVTGGTNPTASRTFTSSDRPGTWKLLATATKDGASTTAAKTFEVHLATRADLNATPTTVNQGGEVTLQGSLQHWSGPAWKNYTGQRVFVSFKPDGAGSYSRVGSATTDGQGHFIVKQKPSKTGRYRAVFEGNPKTEGSISREILVSVRQQGGQSKKDSRISIAARPQSVRAGSKVHLRGTLETGAANAWTPIKGTQVNLLFQEDGTSTWQRVTTPSTAQDGTFDADVTARKSGWWRAEYAGSADIKGAQAQVHVDVNGNGNRPPSDDGDNGTTYDTRITRFKASPRTVDYGSKVRFKGKLQAYDDGWDSYGEQKVTLWFRSKQGWKKVKNAYTNDSGNFSIKVKARKSGYWKVLFSGNDEADGSSSRKKWVTVES